MIFSPSTRNCRVTRPCFRICSTRRSRSQAGLCPCTRRWISKPSEPTLGRLRYILGGDRPSQTTHQAGSLARIHGRRLDSQTIQGGIPRVAPHRLASALQSLPPILYMTNQDSTSSYSKGPRGLSVLLRVAGIFTGNSTSPSLGLRQCSDRYAIRAGRNLPDKEFRYLRTVHHCYY